MNNTLSISDTLSRLMFEKKIRTSELARRINLPQPTVHRIVTGASPRPHLSSLVPLAEFFGITIEQLKGIEPIPHFHKKESFTYAPWREIPLISWEEAANWHPSRALQNKHKVLCDATSSQFSFVLRMEDASMTPQFPVGSLLVIDPEKPAKDRSFVVVKLKNSSRPVFRQLLIDGSLQYVKPMCPELGDIRMTLVERTDRICGTLVQMKLNFIE